MILEHMLVQTTICLRIQQTTLAQTHLMQQLFESMIVILEKFFISFLTLPVRIPLFLKSFLKKYNLKL